MDIDRDRVDIDQYRPRTRPKLVTLIMPSPRLRTPGHAELSFIYSLALNTHNFRLIEARFLLLSAFVHTFLSTPHTPLQVVDIRTRHKAAYQHIKLPALVMLKHASKVWGLWGLGGFLKPRLRAYRLYPNLHQGVKESVNAHVTQPRGTVR